MDAQVLTLVQEITDQLLRQSLSLRYDICTCPECKDSMLKLAINGLLGLNLPLADTTPEKVKETYARDINRLVIHAIDRVSDRPPHPVHEDKKKEFKRLMQRIYAERGLDLRNYHTELLKRRIALRLQKNDVPSYAEYIKFLGRKPQEYDKLFETLCINVSEFLRDPPVWVTIQYLFENLIRIKQQTGDPRIHVWSAGCACGEEPYSIALMLKEALRSVQASLSVQITATDIDKACLLAAKKAVYAKDSVKNIDTKLLARYFELTEGKFAVKEELKRMVNVDYVDLTSGNFPKDTDLIVCRNVFIYFNRDLQRQLLVKFHSSLKVGGYLIMGKSESLWIEPGFFENIDSNARIFRKLSTHER
ncbi:MAG: protein-glutamate O-methyltransferase CheR [Candidatus Omnitrophica bacterium]|nr:protein-glutamate O-methyltransferase CheR [Candidatus Omnitrophota bacterium]